MPCIRLIIEYDGAAFHGYQRQPGLRTVESELSRAVGIVLREPEVRLRSAGRTDAGVSARGQVVNFRTAQDVDLPRLRLAVSSILRHEVAVLSAEIVHDSFDARRDAIAKQYTYTIINRPTPLVLDKRAWRIGGILDTARMVEEARSFLGSHDFTSFRGAGCEAESPRRTIDQCEVTIAGDTLRFRVVGRSFLKHMVRIMVGTLADIGRGLSPRTIAEVLEARDRSAAGVTAPPEGLVLDWVRY